VSSSASPASLLRTQITESEKHSGNQNLQEPVDPQPGQEDRRCALRECRVDGHPPSSRGQPAPEAS
jgi:hypothetical protein